MNSLHKAPDIGSSNEGVRSGIWLDSPEKAGILA